MAKNPPKLIALDPDEYDAKYVGHTKDGRQFFLTFPFVDKRDFIALYLFGADGKFLHARIEHLGPRAQVDAERAATLREEMLASLGETTRRRILVAPFRVERFGVEFGFIPRA